MMSASEATAVVFLLYELSLNLQVLFAEAPNLWRPKIELEYLALGALTEAMVGICSSTRRSSTSSTS